MRPSRVIVIILAGIVLGLAWNTLSGRGLALTRNVYIQEEDEVIEVAEAKRRLDRGALFLDARPRAFYEMSRIPGAVALPEDELETAFAGLERELRSRFDLVVYCSGYGCEASHIVARKLRERGIHAAILHEGLPAWEDAGYALEQGTVPVSALRHPLLERAMGLVLGAVFVYASLDKIAQPAEFARIVYRYQLLGPNALLGPAFANLLATTLPWVELIVGLLLIAGLWRREAALIAAAMLVMFVGAVGWTLAMGIDVENCGCFSVGEQGRQTGWQLLVMDLLLLAFAAALLRPAGAAQAEPAEADVPVAQA